MAVIGEMHYLTIGNSTYSIPSSGGSTVEISRNLTSGTKSATITVDGTAYDIYSTNNSGGTVTSVRVQATSPVQSSTSTAQSSTLNTTISLADAYGDTKNPYGTKTTNYVLAGPSSGSAAAPSFRALVAADIPDLSSTYLTSYTETDPVFSASAASGITSTNIADWNDKQNALTTGDGIDITSNVISNTQGIEYIVGTQAASTNAWTGVSKDTSLKTGKIIAYKLPYAGNSTAATLNLTMADGTTTGAIALRRTGSGTVTTHFAVNNVIILIYDGTYWRVSAYYDANSNYYDRMVWSNVKLTAGAASGRYSMGFVGSDGKFYGFAQTSGTGTAKTLNTGIKFEPSRIFYQLTATYAANAEIAASACYSRYPGIDTRYSCNQGSWMTAGKPVYLIMHLESDGYFSLGSTIFTQTLPTTADGLYYKPVGIAYSTYQMVFEPRDEILYHDGTKLQHYGFSAHTHTKSEITDFPTLAAVATSGNYDDLSNKPSIPTVNNATLTIQKNGSTVKTFTANASTDVTANITVPTKVSELTNDSGFISSYTETDPVFSASAAAGITSTDISNWNNKTSNAGTVTKVTAGTGLSIGSTSGGNFTTSGTINHTNSVTAQTTQAVYPIKIDAQGHISAYGSAVTIPTVPTAVSAFTNDAGYITSADVPEGASAYTGTISAVSTEASNGTNNGFARGDHVHNITSATITSALGYTPYNSTNPNGYISSYTDEKLKWTASTSSNTYYPLQSTSTATTSTANTLNSVSFYQYYNTAGGYRRLILGNSTSYTSSGGAYGTIRLYGTGATYYGDLNPGTLGANRTWTLPNATGTIALTSNIPSSMSGTTASSTTGVTIDDHSSTTIYGVSSSTTTASKVTVGSHSTDYGVTATGSGSFTQGSFSGGSGSFSATVSSHVLSFSHTHTAATHGADSHTHTAPTLGSKVPTVSASDVTVPIKNSSTTTVITSKTHTVNDSGHTHTITVS